MLKGCCLFCLHHQQCLVCLHHQQFNLNDPEYKRCLHAHELQAYLSLVFTLITASGASCFGSPLCKGTTHYLHSAFLETASHQTGLQRHHSSPPDPTHCRLATAWVLQTWVVQLSQDVMAILWQSWPHRWGCTCRLVGEYTSRRLHSDISHSVECCPPSISGVRPCWFQYLSLHLNQYHCHHEDCRDREVTFARTHASLFSPFKCVGVCHAKYPRPNCLCLAVRIWRVVSGHV